MGSLYLQYEYAKTQASFASSLRDCYDFHDTHASEETSLEAIHGEEGPWLQRITHEQYDGENIDEKTDCDEQHKDDYFPASS